MSLYIRHYRNATGRITRSVHAYDFTLTIHTPQGRKRKRFAGILGDSRRLGKTAARLRYTRIHKEAEASLWDDRPATDPVPTVREFTPRFLAHYRVGKATSSVARMQRAYAMLAPTFDVLTLDVITPQVIQAYRATLYAKELSPYTINMNLRCLKLMLDVAIEWGFLTNHPMPKRWRVPEPVSQRTLSPQEEASLLKACSPRFRDVVVVTLDTGMRLGDVIALRWRHIDLSRRLITVPAREAAARGDAARPKTATSRLVGMTARVFDILQRLWQSDTEAKVFGYRYSSIDGLFWAAVKKSGIQSARFHDLRHSFGSRLVEANVNLDKVRQVMGHRRIQTTQRYIHLSDDHTAHVVDALNPREAPENLPTGQSTTEKPQ